jgi:hypothetical protein
MSRAGEATGDESAPLGRRALLAAVVLLAAVAVLFAARSPRSHAAATATCDHYGPSWVRWYNKQAKAQGNPVRMLSACCQSTSRAGVHHCFIKLTLAGTKDLGCATYDLGKNGLPVGIGKHENCALHK